MGNNSSEKAKSAFWAIIIVLGIFIQIKSCVSCDNSSEDFTDNTVEKAPEYSDCPLCGERHKTSELIMCEINPKIYNTVCRKCYEKIQLKKDIKAARNKWVDDNPDEARRRGIRKF